MKTFFSSAVVAASLLSSCGGSEDILDGKKHGRGGTRSPAEHLTDGRHGYEGQLRAENRMGGK